MYDLIHIYDLSDVGYMSLNIKSGKYDWSEVGYIQFIFCLNLVTYSLIWCLVYMTSLTSGVTLLHQNYPCLWHKDCICDTKNDVFVLFCMTLGLPFWHIKKLKVYRLICYSVSHSSKLNTKSTELFREESLLSPSIYI